MSLVLVSGQFLGTYDNSYRLGFDSLSDDFSGSSFGGSNNFGGFGGLASIRDPRQNRGKIKNLVNEFRMMQSCTFITHINFLTRAHLTEYEIETCTLDC